MRIPSLAIPAAAAPRPPNPTRTLSAVPAISSSKMPSPIALAATLTTWLETDGWISMDSHLHSEPSPDSRVLAEDRMKSAAAGGLEVPISTDHEAIVDLSDAVES